tara:strand:- start:1116 stop:1457 length:342 start_codon:yes stop_codon:yes gene_type:complete
MAKGDYTNTTRRAGYRTLVRKQTLAKVSVASDDKRTRAELLDMVEELFETKTRQITAEKLRAFLTVLVLSLDNSSDDTLVINSNTKYSSLPERDPRDGQGKLWNNRGVLTLGS